MLGLIVNINTLINCNSKLFSGELDLINRGRFLVRIKILGGCQGENSGFILV